MQLVGKIIRQELKDVGKGKDAVAHEVLVLTAKLDGEDGIRGNLYFVPNGQDFALGDIITVNVSVKQGKLELTK